MGLLVLSASVCAWGETTAKREARNARYELERQHAIAEQIKQQEKLQAVERVKVNFRLESSYAALKEGRKAFAYFVLAYPVFTALLYYFDAGLGKSYAHWIPHSLLAFFAVWCGENVLSRQVELNNQKNEQIKALS